MHESRLCRVFKTTSKHTRLKEIASGKLSSLRAKHAIGDAHRKGRTHENPVCALTCGCSVSIKMHIC